MMDDAALFCQHEVRSCWGWWKTRPSLFLPSPLSFFMCRRSLRTPSGSQKMRCITPPRDDIGCLLSLRDNGGRGVLCEQRDASGQCTLPLSGVSSGRVDLDLEANTKTELRILRQTGVEINIGRTMMEAAELFFISFLSLDGTFLVGQRCCELTCCEQTKSFAAASSKRNSSTICMVQNSSTSRGAADIDFFSSCLPQDCLFVAGIHLCQRCAVRSPTRPPLPLSPLFCSVPNRDVWPDGLSLQRNLPCVPCPCGTHTAVPHNHN